MPWKDPEIRKQKRKEWYKRTKEVRRQYFTEYRKENESHLTSIQRLAHVKRTYNLDADSYLKMIVEQSNMCAICHKPETATNRNGDVRPLSVDHCHTTGKVRALLCARCNGLLGCCSDDISILEKSIHYLKEHQEN